MTRTWLVRAAVAALLVGIGWWTVVSTEWVDVEVPVPLKGEAARDPLFGLKRLVREVGVPLEVRTGLDDLPPRGARLLLTSSAWTLFKGRPESLRRWVEGGGHLVVPAHTVDADAFRGWSPVTTVDLTKDEIARVRKEDEADHGREVTRRSRQGLPTRWNAAGCRRLEVHERSPAIARTLEVCGTRFFEKLVPPEPELSDWQLRGPVAVEAMRRPVGAGSVTVYGSWDLLATETLLRRDTAQVAAALLQLDRAHPVWVVAEESRPPLLPWLWSQGWIAVVAALAAIAVTTWRVAVRFGPLLPAHSADRRSMREQIAGVATFLDRHGPASLHAAQVRALREAAHRRLPGAGGRPVEQLASAIAAASGLDPAALAAALRPPAHRRDLPATLELLETARRRLEHPQHPVEKP